MLGRERLESKSFIKPLRAFILCMNDNGPQSSDVRCLQGSQQRIAKKLLSQCLSLKFHGACQPCHYHTRYLMPRYIQRCEKPLPFFFGQAGTIAFSHNSLCLWENSLHDELGDVHPKHRRRAADDALFVRIDTQVDTSGRAGSAHETSPLISLN